LDKKKARWARWAAAPLGVAALAAVIVANPFASGATPSYSLMTPADALALKAHIVHGHADPDSLKRPNAAQEGSPSSAEEQALLARAYPLSGVPADGYDSGFSHYSLLKQDNQEDSLGWTQMGPLTTPNGSTWGNAAASTVSGRATAIAVDPATCASGACQTIYLGTANGGVWKTTDAGQHWKVLTDRQSTLAIGSLVLDPSNPNVIYAGTGEPNNSVDSNRGQGILKSTDGGHTWTTLGFTTFVNRAVADIVIDPTSGAIYAISYLGRSGGAGTTYGSSGSNPYLPPLGFYRSTDGGQTWTMSNPTTSFFKDPTGRYGPVSLVRSSAGTLYLGVYGQGLYKSTDGGSNWTALSNPGETQGQFDRVTLAVAPSDANTLYAAYSHTIDANAAGTDVTFYASTDGGTTWTQRANTPSACDGQCWYDMPVNVSATDPKTVYVGGSFNYNFCPNTTPYAFDPNCNTVIMKSTDGGVTFTDIGTQSAGVDVHPDDHAILATAQGGLYDANDGGLYHSADYGTTWESLNNSIGTLQFQGISVNTQGSVFGGTQDNGTWAIAKNSTNGVHIQGGDGGMTAADTSNSNIVFDEYYGSQMSRYDASTGNQTWMSGWWADYFLFSKALFYEPMALGVKNPNGTSASNVVFSGSYRLWRSTQGGGVDANHDGDATNDPGDTTDFVPITPDVGNISAIAVSPTDPNVVAIATSTGHIYYTTNALAPVTLANSCATHSGDLIAAYCSAYSLDSTSDGAHICSHPWENPFDTSSFCEYVSGVTWTQLDVNSSNTKLLPGRWVSALAIDPRSPSTVYATFSGFDQNTPGFSGHVFVTRNASSANFSWTNITGNSDDSAIPNIPANSIVVTPSGNTLVVAADIGVFVSRDGGQSWQREDGTTLPAAPIYNLALSPDGSTLYAATHGRGIWSARLSDQDGNSQG
jgi:photosystem II stability/assembly factor-like uncharacterized protein